MQRRLFTYPLVLGALLFTVGPGSAAPLGAEVLNSGGGTGEVADGGIQLASVVTENPISKSISSALSDAADGIGSVLTPEEQVERAPDATSLDGQSAEPSPKLYVSFARLYENSNKVAQAEQQYQQALKLDPNYLDALLGYGRLKERLGKQADAAALYQAAIKAHPNEASAYNHLGLCYARRRMLPEAKQAFGQAIQLRPKNPGLRNHIAIVLVEMGRINEAFAHLRVVHGDAVAHYNIGCAVYKKGDSRSAAQHFAAALQEKPDFVQARQWLEWLGRQPAEPPSIGHYASQRQPSASPPAGSANSSTLPRITTPGGNENPHPRQTNPYGRPGQGSPGIRPLPSTESAPQARGMSEPAPLPPIDSSSVAPPRGPANAPPGANGQPEDDLPVAPMPPGAPPPVIESLPPLDSGSPGN